MFDTYGPFRFSTEADNVSHDSLEEFWEEVDDAVAGLSSAMGIYIFATQDEQGLAPQ